MFEEKACEASKPGLRAVGMDLAAFLLDGKATYPEKYVGAFISCDEKKSWSSRPFETLETLMSDSARWGKISESEKRHLIRLSLMQRLGPREDSLLCTDNSKNKCEGVQYWFAPSADANKLRENLNAAKRFQTDFSEPLQQFWNRQKSTPNAQRVCDVIIELYPIASTFLDGLLAK